MKRFALVSLVLLFALSVAAAVYADCSTLTFLTESLPDGTVGQPYSFQIQGIGGTEPYHFTLYAGPLPAGLHLTGSGQIHGVPTEVTDTTIFVTITDAQGCTLTQAYAFRVNA